MMKLFLMISMGKKLPFGKFVCALMMCLVAGAPLFAQNTVNTSPYVANPANTTGNIFNIITTWEATAPDTSATHLITRPVSDVKQTKQYFDGMTRLLQTVGKQFSPLGNDVVTPVYFDPYGKNSLTYLQFVSNTSANSSDVTNDGNIKLDAFKQQTGFYNSILAGQAGETNVGSNSLNWAYGQTNYEASPLNRVLATYAPGVNWVGSAGGSTPHDVQTQYETNTATDDVQNWSCAVTSGAIPTDVGTYAAGLLFKKITTDEAGNQVIEYTNYDGHMVLRQVQNNPNPTPIAGWLNTYYIYDDIGNLRYILQPDLVLQLWIQDTWSLTAIPNLLNNLSFYYEYDQRNRLIIKREPGLPPVYMVYDARDRMVMTQDGNLRNAGQWLVTVYDNLNRQIETGLLADATTTFATELSNAYSSTSYPGTASNFTVLTQTFYDNYAWQSSTPLSSGFDVTQTSSGFEPASTTAYPYAVNAAVTPYTTLGLPTGVISKVMTTPNEYSTQNLYYALYYDDHNRMVQSQDINVSGGKDETTNQYAFDGKPLVTKVAHNKAGTNAQAYTVVTTKTYDAVGRVQSVVKNVSNGTLTDQQTIATNSYDELSRLKTKALGASIDNLTYDYNVRSWLLGINRAYLGTVTNPTNITPSVGNWFGLELAYDKTTSSAVDNTYAHAQYNGTIAGTVWKSASDGIGRKYDYTYGNSLRLTAANYSQDNGTGGYDVSAGLNFTVRNLQYDADGNIVSMSELGWQLGQGSSVIDSLWYDYNSNSNQLLNVLNPNSNPNTTLGDFRYSPTYTAALNGPKPGNATDYTYDANGNQTSDKNKDITGITYNYKNLPLQITIVNSKGTRTIQYVYDASGNKLQKITTEPNGTVNNNGTNVTSTITTTTTYIGAFVYSSVSYSTSSLSTLQYTDNLQFLGQEEGRVRALYKNAASPNTLTGYAFDYFEKDHLGNTRVILTDEAEIDYYPPATLEGSTSSNTSAVYYEQNFYSINSAYIVPSSTVTGLPSYANDNNTYDYTTSTNLYPSGNSGNTNAAATSANVYRINGSANKMGLGITLKVMAGDKLSISGKSYYFTNNAGDNTSYNLPVLTLLTGFLGAPGASALPGAADAGVTASELDNISSLVTNVGNYLTNTAGGNTRTPTTSSKPRAYLNWVFFDNQMNYAGGGFQAVGSAATLQDYYTLSNLQNITAPKSGFVYVYCSNESPVDVFFDNIQVVQTRGPLIEENHYYPFGLTMAGISDKAVKNQYPENKYRFDAGNELQNKEFSDGSGLQMYDMYFRALDPQLGRFWQPDPIADDYAHVSPYSYALNDPIAMYDPLGSDNTVNIWQAIVDLWNSGGGEWDADLNGDGKGTEHNFGSQDEAFERVLDLLFLGGELGKGDEAIKKFHELEGKYNTSTKEHLDLTVPVQVTGRIWLKTGGKPIIKIDNWAEIEEALAKNGSIGFREMIERAEVITETGIANDVVDETRGLLKGVHDFKWGVNETSKTFENAGYVFAGISTVLNIGDAINNKQWRTHNTIDAIATGITLIPGVGEVFGGLWFVGNIISECTTGKGLSENIAKAVGGQ
jgi:RHS repeat-associated protein